MAATMAATAMRGDPEGDGDVAPVLTVRFFASAWVGPRAAAVGAHERHESEERNDPSIEHADDEAQPDGEGHDEGCRSAA